MKSVVSYTTRPKRIGEIDGVNYHYISEEEFFEKQNNNFFAKTTSYNVAVDGGQTWYYGSAIKDLTDDKVAIMNPEELREIKKIESIHPIVFHIVADDETIWNRLRQRGDNSEEARRRLNADDVDFQGIGILQSEMMGMNHQSYLQKRFCGYIYIRKKYMKTES